MSDVHYQGLAGQAQMQQARRVGAERGLGLEYGLGTRSSHDLRRNGMARTLQINFVGNGYLVSEHWTGQYETVPGDKPPMVFQNATGLLAYLTEQTIGGPGGDVRPVDPEQAGLDLGPEPIVDTFTDLNLANMPHRSDCAVYNEPTYPNGPCDCGAVGK